MSTVDEGEMLDADELLHLALNSMDANDNEHALIYLKRALALAPDDGRLHYLLGAVHAELGMDERAIAEIGHAVQLSPRLHTAHFQLGALRLKRGDIAGVREAWQPLDALDATHPLALFRTGLLALIDGDTARCIAALKDGIAGNEENDALNEEMRAVLQNVESLPADISSSDGLQSPAPAAQSAGKRAGSAARRHVLLTGYQKADTKKPH